mmetsp:Transcript_2446/g.5607  ORF Transcript_2446/g.5607 Transcript_2446/m.5607 type:complete len:358 (-) Transcript_2446:80-1153(-)
MVARLCSATIHRTAVGLGLAERVAVACALLLPLLVAGATVVHGRASLVPHGVVENVAGVIVRRDPADHLVSSARHWARAVNLRLTPGTPVVAAGLLVNGVAGAGLVDGVASLVVACIPIRIAVVSVGCHPAILLIRAAGDGARLRLLLAPAVAPLICALVLPLRIAGAARVRGRAIFTVVRVVHHARRIVAVGVAVRLRAVAVERAGAPGGIPAVAREGVLALHFVVHASDVERVEASNALLLAVLVAPAVTLLLPLLVAGATFLVGGARGLSGLTHVVDLTCFGVGSRVAVHLLAVYPVSAVAAVAGRSRDAADGAGIHRIARVACCEVVRGRCLQSALQGAGTCHCPSAQRSLKQ